MKRYTFRNLEQELRGVTLAGRTLSRQLVQSLGVEQALRWYYHTPVHEFADATPHAYVVRLGDKGKKRLARGIYYLLTGQSE